MKASLKNAQDVYGAADAISVEVTPENLPANVNFDLYSFFIKYDADKLNFTDKEVDALSAKKVVVDSEDDALFAETGELGTFVQVLYAGETLDVSNETVLGDYSFVVEAEAGVADVNFKVVGFLGAQINGEPGSATGVEYVMGTSTPASAKIDTEAPVISGVASQYELGAVVSGNVADDSAYTLTITKMEEGAVAENVEVVDGAFSIADLAVGQYKLTATDAADNASEVLFSVVSTASEMKLQPAIDKSAYKAGDTVSLNVLSNFSELSPDGILTFGFEIPYDADALEFIGVDAEAAANGVEANAVVDADGNGVVKVALSEGWLEQNPEDWTYFQGNNVGTYQFKVLEGKAETNAATLSITEAVAAYVNEDLSIWNEWEAESAFNTAAFMIDSIAPVISGIEDKDYGLGDEITVSAADTYLDYMTINGEKVDGASKTLVLIPGTYDVKAYDVAGNESAASINVADPADFAVKASMPVSMAGYPDVITVNYGSNLMEATNNLGMEAYSFIVNYDPSVYAYKDYKALNDAEGLEVYDLGNGTLNVVCMAVGSEEGGVDNSFNALKADDLVAINFTQVGAKGDTAIKTSEVLAATVVGGDMYILNTADVEDVYAVAVTSAFDKAFIMAGDSAELTLTVDKAAIGSYDLTTVQFDLLFDTDRFEAVIDDPENGNIFGIDGGVRVMILGGVEGEPVPTNDFAKVKLVAKEIEGEEGLVPVNFDVANISMSYENIEAFDYIFMPVVVEGSQISVQYAPKDGELNFENIPVKGQDDVQAVVIPMMSADDAKAALEEAFGDVVFGDTFGTGADVTINGQTVKVVLQGDITGDGAIGAVDLVMGKSLIFLNEDDTDVMEQLQRRAFDVDNNGKGSVLDLLAIKMFILQG
ncbi:cohesin domain-containing protein [Candidatus Soleaferrea massiliensis]|uniref:cohesin domain-containing protein n=1 Tax=Candidatus Soleaferrea massiliensis TaxID=1470354 RepID=UPI00058B7A6F|nr:cohesin domain-containing protein [Candidatus Soleaferrea massiliensis]